MTIGQLHAAKRAALKDYAEADATAKVAKAAYDAASDVYMDAIAPYAATIPGYLESAPRDCGVGTAAREPHANGDGVARELSESV